MSDRAIAADDVVVEEIDDELCLLRIDTSEVLVLNRTAADVWLLAYDGTPTAAVVDALAAAYQRPASELTEDVTAVLADLRDRGFLVDAE